jgi:hypothetical protein
LFVDRARLGTFILALGSIDIVRLIPEAVRNLPIGTTHLIVLGLDLLLGVGMIAAGQALRRGKTWATSAGMGMAGAVTANSVAWSIVVVPFLLGKLDQAGVDASDFDLVPRLLFYAMAIVLWPYGARILLRCSPPGSRRKLLALFGVGGVLGALLMSGIYFPTHF